MPRERPLGPARPPLPSTGPGYHPWHCSGQGWRDVWKGPLDQRSSARDIHISPVPGLVLLATCGGGVAAGGEVCVVESGELVAVPVRQLHVQRDLRG